MDVYAQWDACSNGKLNLIRRSPAHLRAAVLAGGSESDALKFGSAAHMAILEPELFETRYRAKDQCAAFTGGGEGPRCQNTGKYLLESGEILCGTHKPRDAALHTTVALIDDYAACIEMKAAVARKRRAAGLVGAAGDFEVSIVWDEDVKLPGGAYRLRMKGRLDHYSPDLDRGTILDLKSTLDAQEGPFMRTVYKYGYHRQGWLYRHGCRALGLPAEHYAVLAMEKAPPYEVGVFRMTEAALDAGEQSARALMGLYARCQQSGEWPGYPDRVRDITLPDWAWKATDEETEELEETWQLR
jgi:hypothetical protein